MKFGNLNFKYLDEKKKEEFSDSYKCVSNTSTYLIFKVLCSHLLDLRVGGEKDKEKMETICCNRVKRKKKEKKKAGESDEFMFPF